MMRSPAELAMAMSVIITLKMEIASVWDMPCRAIPFTDRISSPGEQGQREQVAFIA